MLGEAISLDGGALVFVVIVLLLVLAAAVAAFLAGCMYAHRAGVGSRDALLAWIAIVVLELLVAGSAIPSLVNGNIDAVFVVPVTAVLVQVGLYVSAWRRRPGA